MYTSVFPMEIIKKMFYSQFEKHDNIHNSHERNYTNVPLAYDLHSYIINSQMYLFICRKCYEILSLITEITSQHKRSNTRPFLCLSFTLKIHECVEQKQVFIENNILLIHSFLITERLQQILYKNVNVNSSVYSVQCVVGNIKIKNKINATKWVNDINIIQRAVCVVFHQLYNFFFSF